MLDAKRAMTKIFNGRLGNGRLYFISRRCIPLQNWGSGSEESVGKNLDMKGYGLDAILTEA